MSGRGRVTSPLKGVGTSPANRRRVPRKRRCVDGLPRTPRPRAPPRADGAAQEPRRQQSLLARCPPYVARPPLDNAAKAPPTSVLTPHAVPYTALPGHSAERRTHARTTPTGRPTRARTTPAGRPTHAAERRTHAATTPAERRAHAASTPAEHRTRDAKTPTDRMPHPAPPWFDESVPRGATPSWGRAGGVGSIRS